MDHHREADLPKLNAVRLGMNDFSGEDLMLGTLGDLLGLDTTRREELVERVTEALEADDRVRAVELYGSLARGKPDQFSDIDVIAHLRSGVVDRDFLFALPSVMAPLGGFTDGWSFAGLPDQYAGTFIFDDYPLFWSVDIGCVSDRHVDGSDLVATYRWEQIYKVWIGAAKKVARAEDGLAAVTAHVARHTPVEQVPSAATRQLRLILDAIETRKIRLQDPYERLHKRCSELLDDLERALEALHAPR